MADNSLEKTAAGTSTGSGQAEAEQAPSNEIISEEYPAAIDPSIDIDSLPDLPLDPEEPDEVSSEPANTDTKAADDSPAPLDPATSNTTAPSEPTAPTEAVEDQDPLSAEVEAAIAATAQVEPASESDEADSSRAETVHASANERFASFLAHLNPRLPLAIGAIGALLGFIGLHMNARTARQVSELTAELQALHQSMAGETEKRQTTTEQLSLLETELDALGALIEAKMTPMREEVTGLNQYSKALKSQLDWNNETIQLINLTIGKLFDEKVEANRAAFKDELVTILRAQSTELATIAQPVAESNESHSHHQLTSSQKAQHPTPCSPSQPAGSAHEVAPTTGTHSNKPQANHKSNFTIHYIEFGDTVAKIAQKYHITENVLFTANPKLDPRKLKIGQAVYVPPKNG